MTEQQQEKLNDFFVGVFNQILAWEGQTIKNIGVQDLSIRELHVIEAVSDLCKLEKNTMANIAKHISLSPGALSVAVNALVNKGYLERSYTAKDRRVIYITVTEKGKKVNEYHEAFHYEMIQAVGDQLDEQQLNTMFDALDKLKEFFKSKISH